VRTVWHECLSEEPGVAPPATYAGSVGWAQMLLQLVSEREERGFSDWFADVAT